MSPTLERLPNGTRILLVPMRESKTATVLVLVEAGSAYESKRENGVSHFLEHLCFKGTERRSDSSMIARELDALGASYNAFTGHEYTGYYAKVAAERFAEAFDLIADVSLHPIVDPGEMEKEKGVITGEIDMYEDLPMRKVQMNYSSLLYGDQPAGWSILGEKDVIRAMTREDILRYRQKHYVPSATLLVVAGRFAPGRVRKMARESFGIIARGNKGKKVLVRESQSHPMVHLEERSVDQTHLVFGFRTTHLASSEHPALDVLAAILGSGMSSRLFRKIRDEMGAGYYVHASSDAATDHGSLSASAGVDPARAEEVISAIRNEFLRLRDEPVGKEELMKVKDMITGRILLGLESSDQFAEYYGFQEILRKKRDDPEVMIKRVRAVSASRIQSLARKYFLPERENLAVIGPYQGAAQFETLLN